MITNRYCNWNVFLRGKNFSSNSDLKLFLFIMVVSLLKIYLTHVYIIVVALYSHAYLRFVYFKHPLSIDRKPCGFQVWRPNIIVIGCTWNGCLPEEACWSPNTWRTRLSHPCHVARCQLPVKFLQKNQQKGRALHYSERVLIPWYLQFCTTTLTSLVTERDSKHSFVIYSQRKLWIITE